MFSINHGHSFSHIYSLISTVSSVVLRNYQRQQKNWAVSKAKAKDIYFSAIRVSLVFTEIEAHARRKEDGVRCSFHLNTQCNAM
jgi:hypothetical protein